MTWGALNVIRGTLHPLIDRRPPAIRPDLGQHGVTRHVPRGDNANVVRGSSVTATSDGHSPPPRESAGSHNASRKKRIAVWGSGRPVVTRTSERATRGWLAWECESAAYWILSYWPRRESPWGLPTAPGLREARRATFQLTRNVAAGLPDLRTMFPSLQVGLAQADEVAAQQALDEHVAAAFAACARQEAEAERRRMNAPTARTAVAPTAMPWSVVPSAASVDNSAFVSPQQSTSWRTSTTPSEASATVGTTSAARATLPEARRETSDAKWGMAWVAIQEAMTNYRRKLNLLNEELERELNNIMKWFYYRI